MLVPLYMYRTLAITNVNKSKAGVLLEKSKAHKKSLLVQCLNGNLKLEMWKRGRKNARFMVHSVLLPESFTVYWEKQLAPSVLLAESLQRLVRAAVLLPERVTSSAPFFS